MPNLMALTVSILNKTANQIGTKFNCFWSLRAPIKYKTSIMFHIPYSSASIVSWSLMRKPWCGNEAHGWLLLAWWWPLLRWSQWLWCWWITNRNVVVWPNWRWSIPWRRSNHVEGYIRHWLLWTWWLCCNTRWSLHIKQKQINWWSLHLKLC